MAVTAPFIEDRSNYFAAILAGIADALEDANTKLLLLPARRDRVREARLRDRLRPGSAEGVIPMMPLESTDELVDSMGRIEVNLLFWLLDKQRIDAQRVVLAAHLVKRESTAATSKHITV